MPGSQAGISALILLAELKTMEISVSTSDSQVMTPTVKSKRKIALLRMLELRPKKANQRYDWLCNDRNNTEDYSTTSRCVSCNVGPAFITNTPAANGISKKNSS